jgi:hypothetical protein
MTHGHADQDVDAIHEPVIWWKRILAALSPRGTSRATVRWDRTSSETQERTALRNLRGDL